MRINLMRPAVILLTVALTVSAVGCNRSGVQSEGPTPPGVGISGSPDFYVAPSVTVTAGKAASLDSVYTTKNNGPGKLSLVVFNIGIPFHGGPKGEIPMPSGLEVSIEPKELMAYPNNTYHQTISINASAELPPGIYSLVWRSSFEGGGTIEGPLTVTVEPAPAATNITSASSLNQTTNQTTNTEGYSPATSAIYMIVSPPESGSVSPSTGNYTYGTNVTFIATPANGYVFSSWWYEYSDSTGTRGGVLGKNATLNLAIERSESVTAYFVALPTNWNNALSLSQVHRPIAVGEYFYISQDYIAGQFGPDSVNATFDESLVAFIDRKDAGSVGPLTPGMHSAAVWLLFKALKPGTTNISVTQIRNNYSDPPKTYSATIGN